MIIMIMGCHNPSRGTKGLQGLQSRNALGTLSDLELDVTGDDSIACAAQKITNDFGVIDLLVNNAGIALARSQDRSSELREILHTNSVGPVVLTEVLLPLLKNPKTPESLTFPRVWARSPSSRIRTGAVMLAL